MIRRTLRRRYAGIVIAILGATFILVGVAVSILSLTAFRSLPFRDPATLVQFLPLKDGNLDLWQRDTLLLTRPALRVVRDVAAYTVESTDLELRGTTRTATVIRTTDNFFSMLGLRASAPGSSGHVAYGPGRAIVSRGFLDAAGVDPADIVGKSIVAEGRSVLVVGVVNGDDAFPISGAVWVAAPTSDPAPEQEWFAIARLRQASDVGLLALQGRTALQRIVGPPARSSLLILPIADVTRPRLSSNQRTLSAGIAIFAIIAILNYALLSVGEARRRSREFGVRVALGATSRQVAAAFLAEQGVLIGSALAIALVILGIARASMPVSTDGIQQVATLTAIPPQVWSVIAVGFIGLLGVALIPWRVVAQFAGTGPLGANTIGADRSERIRTRAFIALQFAVTAFLVVTAGSAAMTMYLTHTMDFGFITDNMTFGTVNFATPPLQDSQQAKLAVASIDAAIRAALPHQPVAVWGTTYMAGLVRKGQLPVAVDGPTLPPPTGKRETQWPFLSQDVSAGFFDVLGIRVLRGRGFLLSDRDGAPPVAVVTELMARRMWGLDNTIGKRVRLGGDGAPWMTVVGVVAQTQFIDQIALDFERLGLKYPLIYRPLAQTVPHALMGPFVPHGRQGISNGVKLLDYGVSIVVRGSPEANAIKAMTTALARIAPDEHLMAAGPLSYFLDHAGLLALSAFTTRLLGGFTAAGLALAIFGAACLIDEVIRQRTNEIGIRMALGAQPRSLMILTGQATFLTGAAGTIVGSLIGTRLGPDVELWLTGQWGTGYTKAFASARVTPGTLFIAGSIALLLAVLALGTIWRAKRATRLDPLEALRVQ